MSPVAAVDAMQLAMPASDNERPKKQPNRPHYIREWAAQLGLGQSGLAKALKVDKSVVSRWYSGSSPSEDHQGKLAELFECGAESIFRHPSEVWLAEFMAGRQPEEVARIKAVLEAGFPRKKKES